MLRSFVGRGRPRIAFNSNLNLVFDGNSLMWGSSLGSASPYNLPNRIGSMAPVSGSGASVFNCSFSSGQWTGGPYPMGVSDYGGGQTDSRWAAGKVNVLLCWETTNQVYLSASSSPSANAAQAEAYLAARRAAGRKWIAVYISTIPREAQEGNWGDRAAGNAALVAADEYIRDNLVDIGFDAYINLRQAGSPFAFTGYTTSDFSAVASLWQASEAVGSRVHLSSDGYGAVASIVAAALPDLVRRPR